MNHSPKEAQVYWKAKAQSGEIILSGIEPVPK
jgi:hypothetical protein